MQIEVCFIAVRLFIYFINNFPIALFRSEYIGLIGKQADYPGERVRVRERHQERLREGERESDC